MPPAPPARSGADQVKRMPNRAGSSLMTFGAVRATCSALSEEASTTSERAMQRPSAPVQEARPSASGSRSITLRRSAAAELASPSAPCLAWNSARVTKAQALLRSLPPDTPVNVGRHVVMASLRAFDVSLEEIVEAANSEISALVSFIQAGEDHTAARMARGEARIQELLAEIEAVKANLAASAERQQKLTGAAREEMERVMPVLEFFEADVADDVAVS